MLKSSSKIYNKYYSNQKKENISWLSSSAYRKEFIKSVYKKLKYPIKVLDVGCGNGQNTKWIGDIKGNKWAGIDSVKPEILKINIPKNGKFVYGDFNDAKIFKYLSKAYQKFDLIVDQGGGVNLSSK